MSRILKFTLLLLLTNQASANVVGIDKRKTATSDDPAHAKFVGRLDSGCTAVRLSTTLVLTNLHCIIEEALAADGLLIFRPDIGSFRAQLVEGRSDYVAKPIRAWYDKNATDPRSNPDRDWAILLLDNALIVDADNNEQTLLDLPGVTDGEEQSSVPHFSLPHPRVMLIGYSRDRDDGDSPSLDPYCTLDRLISPKSSTDSSRYALLHDCQFSKGASGGALFVLKDGRYKLLALQQGQYVPEDGDDLSEIIFPDDGTGRAANAGIAIPIDQISDVITNVKKYVNASDLAERISIRGALSELDVISRHVRSFPGDRGNPNRR